MNAIRGAIIAVISSLFISMLFAYIFRFPIPMGGLVGPVGGINPYGINVFEQMQAVFFAWVFYGAFGGFIVVPAFGAIAGFIVGRKRAGSENKNRLIMLWSTVASGIPVLFLSTLDYIIGPW